MPVLPDRLSTPCLGTDWCSMCARELNIHSYVIGGYCDRGKFFAEMHARTFGIPYHGNFGMRGITPKEDYKCGWCGVRHTEEEALELNKQEKANREICICPNCKGREEETNASIAKT